MTPEYGRCVCVLTHRDHDHWFVGLRFKRQRGLTGRNKNGLYLTNNATTGDTTTAISQTHHAGLAGSIFFAVREDLAPRHGVVLRVGAALQLASALVRLRIACFGQARILVLLRSTAQARIDFLLKITGGIDARGASYLRGSGRDRQQRGESKGDEAFAQSGACIHGVLQFVVGFYSIQYKCRARNVLAEDALLPDGTRRMQV